MQTTTTERGGDTLKSQTIATGWIRDAVERAGGWDATVEVTREVTPFGTFVLDIRPA